MPLIKINKKITRDEVYAKLDEAQIFSYYFGKFTFNKSYPSVFRKDINPSTGFYVNKSGKIIYNDIVSGEKLDCFAFVAKKFNISYGEAINKIACDFGLINCNTPTQVDYKQLKSIEKISDYVKKDTDIDIQYRTWDEEALSYWKDYHITQDELDKEQVYLIDKLKINGKAIPNFRNNLRFAYTLTHKDRIYKKIYEPFADKKFKWFTNIPIYLPFGYDHLSYETDTLIITKSQKERLLFLKYFKDVISVQNEGASSLRDVTIKYFKSKYKNLYLFFDIDSTGLENAKVYEGKGLTPIYLPLNLVDKGIKDSADFVKEYGLDKFEKFLIYNNVK